MALYTFGYEGLDIASFIGRLRDAEIKSIVDVRELPLSRKKGFSKNSFKSALANAGIAYLHVPALGCPKEIRDRFKFDSDWAGYTKAFLAYLRTQDTAIVELLKISRASAACLVCFEADFNFCHRTYVARAAHQRGAPAVVHITAQKVTADSPLRVAA